jgi:serine protease
MRGLPALALVLLIPLLAGCSALFSPELEITAQQLLLDSASPSREVTIVNSGPVGSVLRWTASVDSPLVHVSPLKGEIRAGAEVHLRISMDFSGLEQGSVSEATVHLGSNGGQASLPVRFHMNASRTCADGEPELASTDSADLPELGAFVPGELLVGYEESFASLTAAGENEFRSLSAGVRQDHRLRLLGSAEAAGFERVAVEDPLAAAKRLAEDPRVSFAHPNYYVRPAAMPNDPCYPEQWNLHDFGVPGAWLLAGKNRVVVAVIDTGVDVDHVDLRSKSLPGYDLWDDDTDPRPGGPGSTSGHGTHVAGIALALADNGSGIAGVASSPNVMLLPIKIFDDTGTLATIADLADAMLWAAGINVPGLPRNPHPADIINMSLGAGPKQIAALDRAAERARKAGALLLAAAGNNTSTDGSKGIQSPANAPAVIAVGSVDQSMRRSRFSDWGTEKPSVELMAPGGYGSSSCRRVRSTVPWSNYSCMAGTSMASPFAAGVAALILTREPALGPDELERRLHGASYFDGKSMTQEEYGSGILCADRAVAGTRDRSRPCSTW